MNTLMRAAALATCALSAAGCQGMGGAARPGYDDLVVQALDVDAFDREECSLALARARSPQVRALAAELLAQASPPRARAPSDPMPADLRVRAYRLRFAQGGEFDSAFVADQIFAREAALARADAADRGRALASQTAASLRADLAKLRGAVAVADASR